MAGAVHASEHVIDVGGFLLKLRLGLLNALFGKTRCLLDIPAGKRRQHELENALLETLGRVLFALADVGALQQRFDIAEGMGGQLQLLHQSADDIFLKRSAQHDVEDADMRVDRRQALNRGRCAVRQSSDSREGRS